MAEKWMQTVHPKKGALRKALHVTGDQPIPEAKLKAAEHSASPLMRKRANLAERYRAATHHHGTRKSSSRGGSRSKGR